MKKLLLIGACALLSACQPSAVQKEYPILPDDLKDCKFYRLSNGMSDINVARCPNSTTTTKTTGKNPKTTITIDGKEYVQK